VAEAQVDRLAIRTPSIEAPVDALSGGNQQKVLIARAMLAEPRVLLADEPTRGVDVGARVEIYRILRDAADAGQAVVVHSSDTIELQGLCDRVLVFSRGRVVRELDGDAVTEDEITGAAVTATAAQADRARGTRRPDRWRRFLRGDYAPSLVLLVLVLLLAAYTASVNDRFLSERNLQGMLLLASALAFVSLGQQVIVLAGGLDLSVGAVAAMVVIAISSFVVDGSGAGELAIALAASLAIGALVGVANGFLVRWVKLPPVLATLASLIVLQGIALLLRPQPGGMIDRPFTDLLKTTLGPLPVAFLVALVAMLVCEWALRRTRVGLWLRAVGSDEAKAYRTGAPVRRTWVLAFVACSMFAAAGGVMLSSQVGIGDARLGGTYALTSITAVVLGGASIFGGRGSFVGAFLGACLLQTIFSATTFLSLGTAWQYWLPGILVLVAAGLFSRARGIRAAALAGEGAT
jgi:ribose transport system ATP-binding protein